MWLSGSSYRWTVWQNLSKCSTHILRYNDPISRKLTYNFNFFMFLVQTLPETFVPARPSARSVLSYDNQGEQHSRQQGQHVPRP